MFFYFCFSFGQNNDRKNGKKKNRSKRKKTKSTVAVNVDGGQAEEEEENSKIITVKTSLKNILKPKYRNTIIEGIAAKSIEATKLCALGSLLVLYKVQKAYDTNHIDFFRQNGEDVIRDCFLGLIPKNFAERKTPIEFQTMIQEEGINWPNTRHFGNAIKDLYDTYTTNLKTNLSTHAKKRVREYVKMKIFQRNRMKPLVIQYQDEDIDHVIAWAIFGNDSIKQDDPDCVAKRLRRGMLLKMLTQNSWFDIPYNSIGKFTKIHWFESVQFYIKLQREMDEYNSTEEYRKQRQLEREHIKKCHDCKCGQMKGPPRIRNLTVIPICSFKRSHFTVDNYTFYNLLCSSGIAPQTAGKRKEYRNVTFKEFMSNKESLWSWYFRIRKMKWLVRYKKKFRFRILTDGQAASLAYDIEKKKPVPIEKQQREVVQKYKKGEIPYESGTDPGVNTWQATTLRNVETGKEVSVY